MSDSNKIIGLSPLKSRDCVGAKEIVADLQKWADEGIIKSICVGVIFTDNRSFTDWCADYPLNLEHAIGNIDRLKYRMLTSEEQDSDD